MTKVGLLREIQYHEIIRVIPFEHHSCKAKSSSGHFGNYCQKGSETVSVPGPFAWKLPNSSFGIEDPSRESNSWLPC